MDNELYRFDDGDDDVSIKGVNLMNGYIIGQSFCFFCFCDLVDIDIEIGEVEY